MAGREPVSQVGAVGDVVCEVLGGRAGGRMVPMPCASRLCVRHELQA